MPDSTVKSQLNGVGEWEIIFYQSLAGFSRTNRSNGFLCTIGSGCRTEVLEVGFCWSVCELARHSCPVDTQWLDEVVQLEYHRPREQVAVEAVHEGSESHRVYPIPVS